MATGHVHVWLWVSRHGGKIQQRCACGDLLAILPLGRRP